VGLLAGGSLKYEAPVPALARYEPTGTWMSTASTCVTYSNDGINWQKAEFVTDDDNWPALPGWVFGAGFMVVPASAISFFRRVVFKMTNTNPVEFEFSENAPSPPEVGEENDEFHAAQRLSYGPGAGNFIGTLSSIIRSSGDAIHWNEELPIPSGFGDSGLGQQLFMPEVGLHIRLGSGEFPADPGTYWTSGNGLGWTERVFPVHFSSSPSLDIMVGNALGGDDDVVVVGMQHNGQIYRTLDGVNWSLRLDPFPVRGITNIAWNPQANNGAGAFFAVRGGTQPDNLLTSADGIFWNAVDPNDLPIAGDIACDANKNLMICRQSIASQDPEFGSNAYLSDDDGETWKEFGDREGGWLGFIDLKIGPIVDETVFIDTGAIVIAETRATVASTSLKLDGFNTDEANAIDSSTLDGGTVNEGKWADTLDTLNPFYFEIRLDRISGDDFTTASPIDEWTDFDAIWGYFFNAPPESRSMTGTLRVRHKETLIESNSVSVAIDCEVTV